MAGDWATQRMLEEHQNKKSKRGKKNRINTIETQHIKGPSTMTKIVENFKFFGQADLKKFYKEAFFYFKKKENTPNLHVFKRYAESIIQQDNTELTSLSKSDQDIISNDKELGKICLGFKEFIDKNKENPKTKILLNKALTATNYIIKKREKTDTKTTNIIQENNTQILDNLNQKEIGLQEKKDLTDDINSQKKIDPIPENIELQEEKIEKKAS